MAVNAVQREINETLKKHPTWSRIQALHWNRKNNPHTIARHKKEAAQSKKTEREQKTLKKAMNFASKLKPGTKRLVPGARINGGKILAQKNYSGRVGVTYAVDKSTLAFKQTSDKEHFAFGDSRFGSENSNFKSLAKKLFGSKGTRHGSSGRSGG